MAYKCPLCLNELSAKDELIRYCYQCDRADFVKGAAESLRSNLKCRKTKCKSHGQIEEGVYFAHLNCPKPNPFWNGHKLNIPDIARIDGKELTLPFNDNVPDPDNSFKSFKHWQINLLSRTVNSKSQAVNATKTRNVSEIEEMWFPSELLRSTNEKRAGRKHGQIVALVGTRQAGKTFLALQILDREGYLQPDSVAKLEIEDYIYSHRRARGTIEPIFELLRLRYFMRSNQPFPPLQGTVRETLNFYSAFFSPTKKALQKNENGEAAKQTPEPPPQNTAMEIASRLWEKFKKILDLAFAPPKKYFYYTLALCDAAGEDVQKEVEQIEVIKNGADKIALVIDATDLEIKPEEKGILAEHVAGLKKLREKTNKPFCVVLTKMDLFAQYLKSYTAFNFEVEQNRERFYQGDQTVIKELLKNWRAVVKSDQSAQTPINLLNLLNEIILLNPGNPVFTVETQNLPTDPNAVIKNQPVSRGIDTFVCWCLEIGRDDIIEEN